MRRIRKKAGTGRGWAPEREAGAWRGGTEDGRELFFEDQQALASLPFLIGELAARGVDEAMVIGGGLTFLVQGVVGGGPEEESRGVLRQVAGAQRERVQGDVGTAGAGGGEGKAAPAVSVRRIDLRSPVEDGVGLVKLRLANKVLAVSDEQIGIIRSGGEEMEVELVRTGEVAGFGKDGGQHAGDLRVVGVGVMELLEERESLGLVLIGEHGGKLRGERGIVGVFGERGAQKGLGLGILLAQDKQMGQAGAGGDGLWIFVQDAAIGGCGGFVLAGFFGELGGKQGVGGRLGRELESFEQVVGGGSGIGVAIDAGEGTPGAGLECRIGQAGIEGGGGDEFGPGLGKLVLARKEQAKRDVSLERFGIGGDGAAIESGGIVEPVLCVGDVAGVEEGARVGGVGGEVRIEPGFGGLPIGAGDGGFGGGDFGGDGLGGCGGGAGGGRWSTGGRRRLLRDCAGRGEKRGREEHKKNGTRQAKPQEIRCVSGQFLV